ncbi:MAG: hypothetical protein ACK4S4_11075 [Pyrinomonadaceae bacterium]
MFDESLFDQVPAEPLKEGDFLYDYEVKSSWERSPYIYKIVGVSAALNLLIVLVAGQTSLLTAKGCDSPLVGRMCQVLDTVYIGTKLFSTEREYADAVYEKTELEDADITFVDVSGLEAPLEYPEGYFKIANPEQAMASADYFSNPAAGFPSFPTTPYNQGPPPSSGGLINTKPNIPKSNPDPVEGELPTFGDSNTDTANNRKGRGGRPSANANNSVADTNSNSGGSSETNGNSAQNAEEEAKADQYGVYINKRPIKDQAKETLEQLDGNKVQLDKSFKVVVSGSLGLGKDGKTIVLKDPKRVPVDKNVPNDPAMVKLVEDWITAIGDAGWLGYLTRVEPKPKNVVITVEQNETELIASIKADQPTEAQANTQSSSLGLLLAGASALTKGDEQAFLQKASVKADGRSFVLNFVIPKQEAQEMIQRKLAEEKAKAAQPNSTAGVEPKNSTSGK